MAGLTPYMFFSGDAREALSFYAGVFGGETQVIDRYGVHWLIGFEGEAGD